MTFQLPRGLRATSQAPMPALSYVSPPALMIVPRCSACRTASRHHLVSTTSTS